MNYEKYDIILVPFPFTDLSQSKKRPALIMSPNEYNFGKDVIIAFITSNLNIEPKIGDYNILDWQNSNLPKPSIIRMKFATIDKAIIIKTLGKLVANDATNFNKLLLDFLK